MEHKFYALQIKKEKINSYSESYNYNNGLLGTAIEFLGYKELYYHVSSSKYGFIWLVPNKEIALQALSDAPEYEDDAFHYNKMYLKDGMIKFNTDDIEVVKLVFSTDLNKYKHQCFCFLNISKLENEEFLALGWEAKDMDEQPEDEDADAEYMFGPNLICPVSLWESEGEVSSWDKSLLKEHLDEFKGTLLSYIIIKEN